MLFRSSLFTSAAHCQVADYLLAAESADGNLPEQLLDGLEDIEAQALLSGLLLAENQEQWAVDPEKIFADCRKAAAAALHRQRLLELQRLIAEAEQAGDPAALARFARELVDIKKNL